MKIRGDKSVNNLSFALFPLTDGQNFVSIRVKTSSQLNPTARFFRDQKSLKKEYASFVKLVAKWVGVNVIEIKMYVYIYIYIYI